MAYVLILVMSTMQGEAVHTQEFFSKARCNEAREVVKQHAPVVKSLCVRK